MPKVKEIKHTDDDGTIWHQQFLYWCEGCGYEHAFALSGPPFNGHHQWNGDFNNPTITPSLVQGGSKICHSFIRDGKIQYLGDCQHDLRNQTVELKDVEEMLDKRNNETKLVKAEKPEPIEQCPECGGDVLPKDSGVACSKCDWWFCY